MDVKTVTHSPPFTLRAGENGKGASCLLFQAHSYFPLGSCDTSSGLLQ